MARIAPAMSGIVRYGGSLALILGVMIWIGSSTMTPWSGASASLINFHMLLGILAVLALWLLAAGYAMTGGNTMPLVISAVVVGLAQAVLGMTQQGLLSDAHWVIQVLHLLLGLGVIGVGEMMTMRMKKARVAVAAK
ncbi:MAG TPA: hypothetical protein VFQ25_01905 [Ktedonobacterales bacterium]|nr:hypothetical protein [Ktedonobacterales bacterium]